MGASTTALPRQELCAAWDPGLSVQMTDSGCEAAWSEHERGSRQTPSNHRYLAMMFIPHDVLCLLLSCYHLLVVVK